MISRRCRHTVIWRIIYPWYIIEVHGSRRRVGGERRAGKFIYSAVYFWFFMVSLYTFKIKFVKIFWSFMIFFFLSKYALF